MSLVTRLTAPYKQINGKIWLLGLITLINKSSATFFFFAAIYLNQVLGFSIQPTGFALALYGFGCVVGSFCGGLSSEKIGAFLTQVISLLFTALIFILILFTHTYKLLLLLMWLLGIGIQSFRPANDHAISSLANNNIRLNAFSLTRQAANIGTALSSAIAGILANYSFNYLFILNASICFMAAILLFCKRQSLNKSYQKQQAVTESTSSLSCYKNVKFLIFLVAVFSIGFMFFQLITTMPLFIKHAYGADSEDFGFLLAFHGVLIITMEIYLMEYLKKRYSNYQAIACGALLIGLPIFALNVITQWPWIYLMVTIFTLGEMLIMPFLAATVKQIVGDQRAGQGYGLNALAWSTSMFAAPTVGTWLIDYAGYNILWSAILLLSIIATAAVLSLEQMEHRK